MEILTLSLSKGEDFGPMYGVMHRYQRLSAPDIDAFSQLAEAAYMRLPPQFRQAVGTVVFRIQDFADEAVLAEMGIEDPFELSGLYQGVDLSRRSVIDPVPHQSEIFLYRRPILDEWAERGDVSLGTLIEHVLIHEIAHHLGLSDDDIHAIEDAAD